MSPPSPSSAPPDRRWAAPTIPPNAPPPGAPPRLLARVRAAARLRHYSTRTEEAYAGWVRRFVHHHGGRHPETLGAPAVEQFLSHLATVRGVSASTQNQALAALLFLYGAVLGAPLPRLGAVARAKRPPRLPTVLTRAEMRAVLAALRAPAAPGSTPYGLVGLLLYGAGLRLREAFRLRVKDVDLARGELLVRSGKGGKDRVTVLPTAAADPLAAHGRRSA